MKGSKENCDCMAYALERYSPDFLVCGQTDFSF